MNTKKHLIYTNRIYFFWMILSVISILLNQDKQPALYMQSQFFAG